MRVIQKYSIADVQDEVRALVARGFLHQQQRIYELRKYFNELEWENVEQLLNTHDYLLRDRIIDLIGKESWSND
jgi:Domain of unknown function (DUF4327)